mmetsp:Transcript_17106/g.54390  ORF Transcript_17106/g.54390 Transcript_17106/m.54390 type:complete len:295 (+) Transcript_17106:1109-1993(+)
MFVKVQNAPQTVLRAEPSELSNIHQRNKVVILAHFGEDVWGKRQARPCPAGRGIPKHPQHFALRDSVACAQDHPRELVKAGHPVAVRVALNKHLAKPLLDLILARQQHLYKTLQHAVDVHHDLFTKVAWVTLRPSIRERKRGRERIHAAPRASPFGAPLGASGRRSRQHCLAHVHAHGHSVSGAHPFRLSYLRHLDALCILVLNVNRRHVLDGFAVEANLALRKERGVDAPHYRHSAVEGHIRVVLETNHLDLLHPLRLFAVQAGFLACAVTRLWEPVAQPVSHHEENREHADV